MRFSVSHETLYRYSVPVSLAPHLLRLEPRLGGGRLLSRELLVEPAPVLRVKEVDAHGNALTRAESGAPTVDLRIDSRFVIDTVAPVPYSVSGMAPLPGALPLGDGLDAYRNQPWCDPAVAQLAEALPARFVSGYHAPPHTPTAAGNLHAWAEVDLPGIGWQGWDPSNGIPAGAGHVAHYATPDQAGTMAVEGGFSANGVTVTLHHRVLIGTV